MIKSEKIILTGGSGSGKDWLLRQLEKEGLKASVKTTTRPQRKNEIQSISYNFIQDSEFQYLLENNQFVSKYLQKQLLDFSNRVQ